MNNGLRALVIGVIVCAGALTQGATEYVGRFTAGESARSGFADLHFVARSTACDFPDNSS